MLRRCFSRMSAGTTWSAGLLLLPWLVRWVRTGQMLAPTPLSVPIGLFAAGGADPLLQLGTWVPIFCTLAVIAVQFTVSIAVIFYFNRVGRSGSSLR